jgi:hypothetical protein
MRLGRIGTGMLALTMALALAAPAQAYEFNEVWGYGYVDDNPFVNPATGQPGLPTQVFPRGVLRDVPPRDDRDVRLTVLVFMGEDLAPDKCVATEGDFVDAPFSCPITAPARITHLVYAFCRYLPSTGPDTDCKYKTMSRPPDGGTGGTGGGGSTTPAPTDPDQDGDGIPASRDCEDNNARVGPGRREIPGNEIDDDCRNGDKAARIPAQVQSGWGWPTRRAISLRRLRVVKAPPGATATVRCRGGKRCRFKPKRVPVTGTENLRRHVPRRMRFGTTLEVRVVARGWIGMLKCYRIVRSMPPPRTLWLPPGAKKARRC